MASRGFRGQDARIRFSADVTAVTGAQRALQRLFSYLRTQADVSAAHTAKIETQLRRVEQAEKNLQRVLQQNVESAARRAQSEIRAGEQLTRAKERLVALEERQKVASSARFTQDIKLQDRVARAEQRAFQTRESAAALSNKYAERGRQLAKAEETAAERTRRRAEAEETAARRIQNATDAAQKVKDNYVAAEGRRQNQIQRLSAAIVSAEERLSERRRALSGVDQARSDEQLRNQERLTQRAKDLARDAFKAIGTEAGFKTTIPKLVGTEQGLQKVIDKLQEVRNASTKAGRDTEESLSLDRTIASAKVLLSLRQDAARFDAETAARQTAAQNAVSRSERQIASLQTEKATAEGKAAKSAQDYQQALQKQGAEVSRLQKSLDELRGRSGRGNARDQQDLAAMRQRFQEERRVLNNLQAARQDASDRYLSLTKNEQSQLKASHAAQAATFDRSITTSKRNIQILENSLKNLSDTSRRRTANEQAEVDAKTKALATEKAALLSLEQGYKQFLSAQEAGSVGLLNNLTKTIGSVGLLKVALLGMGAIGAGAFGALTYSSAKLGVKLESIRAQFTGLTGDIREARKIIDTAFSISQDLPVSPASLLEGARTLVAVGAKTQELSQDLRALSVVATVANQPMEQLSVIYGEILNKNRLYREDLLQFSRRGIPLMQELSNVTGKSREELDELVSLGQVKFEAFQSALRSLGSENSRYGQAVSQMVNTVSGQLTLLGNDYDALAKEGAEALENIGAFGFVAGVISNVRTEVRGLTRIVEAYNIALADSVTEYKDLNQFVAKTSLGIKEQDLGSIEEAIRKYAALQNIVQSVRDFQNTSIAEDLLSDGATRTRAIKDYETLRKILQEMGLEKVVNPENAESLEAFGKAIDQIRVKLEQLRGGPSNIGEFGLPSVAEAKLLDEAIKDIAKHLEASLSAEDIFALKAKAVNGHFNEQIASLEKRKKLLQEQGGNTDQVNKDIQKTEENRQKVLEQMGKERDKDIIKTLEQAEAAKRLAEVEAELLKQGVILGGKNRIVPEDAAKDVAELITQLQDYIKAKQEANQPIDPGFVQRTNQAIDDRIQQAKRDAFNEEQKNAQEEIQTLQTQLQLMQRGVDTELAKEMAKNRQLQIQGLITEQQRIELDNNAKQLLALGKQEEALKNAQKAAEKAKENFDVGGKLQEEFKGLAFAVQNMNLPLAAAEQQMQKLINDAIELKETFNSTKLDAAGIAANLQQSILSDNKDSEQVKVLNEVKGLLQTIIRNPEDIVVAINKVTDAIKKKNFGAAN